MDMNAVLDKASRRDIEMFAGDEFTLSLTVYPTDGELQAASDMEGSTLALKVYYAGVNPIIDYQLTGSNRTPIFTIEGTEGATTTFAFVSSNTENLKGRYKFQIERTADALTRVLVHGALTVY